MKWSQDALIRLPGTGLRALETQRYVVLPPHWPSDVFPATQAYRGVPRVLKDYF